MKKTRRITTWLVLAIVMIMALTACAPVDCPPVPVTPTAPVETPVPTLPPTPEPTPTFDPDFWLNNLTGWHKVPIAERPGSVDGRKVCYIAVSYENPLLWGRQTNNKGLPILIVSQVPDYGGTTIKQRTIVKPGTEVMVFADGPLYRTYDWVDDDTQRCRAFPADGSQDSYQLTPYNLIDGKDLRIHPHNPLYLRVIYAGMEILSPNP